MITPTRRAVRTSVTKEERQREGMLQWVGFYRKHPHRLAVDYLSMSWMTTIQKILLNLILMFEYGMIIASRGFGKTMLVAAAIVVKCILYPGEEIVIAAGNRGQSLNVLNKIVEKYMPDSPNLTNEIETYKVTPQDAFIKFKNGSIVKVVTARDSSRSARANWVICDEFILIKKEVIDGVLKKFKAGQRTPGFYAKEEYADYPKEPNCETYISSASYEYCWAYKKLQAFFKQMLKGESYVCCGFPYQLPVSEGYYPVSQIRQEMQESDFDSIKFSMEMESIWYGQSSSAFYSYNDLEMNRTIDYPIYPRTFYSVMNTPEIKYVPKQHGELRIIGMDVATAGGNSNDNTCYSILSLTPNNIMQYNRKLVYIEVMNGGHTADQSLRLRQLFYDFEADYVVVDGRGVGAGVVDALLRSQTDEVNDVFYPAWSCVNNPKIAERCSDETADKVVYCIMASEQFNNDAAIRLKDCLKRGKLKLLKNETDGNELLMDNRAFNKLSVEDQVMFKLPYYNTTMFVNETINLSYKVVNNNIRVSEPSSGRKDRYSSVSYANYIATELERNLIRPQHDNDLALFGFKRPTLG